MSKFIEEPKNFIERMVNLERAINEATKYAREKFQTNEVLTRTTSRKWYTNMKCLEAMTEIKGAIDSSEN